MSKRRRRRHSRRSYLAGALAALSGGVAGCTTARDLATGDPEKLVGGAVAGDTSQDMNLIDDINYAAALANLDDPNRLPAIGYAGDRGFRKWADGDDDWQHPVESFPVYSDIRNVDDPFDGLQVQLDGTVQQPAGTWWRHDGQWYSGDRTKTAALNEDVGSKTTKTLTRFTMPSDMEVDVWQAQVDVLTGSNEAIYMDSRPKFGFLTVHRL